MTLLLVMAAVPIVAADTGSAHTIKIWPVGTTSETGRPIITFTPTTLFILHTGQGPIKNVWLLIAINEPTYDNLNMITINGTEFLNKTDFTILANSWIPLGPANSTTGYPGTTWHYMASGLRGAMNETNKIVYWTIKYFLPEITTIPQTFTVAVELTAPANLKALILGLGRYDDPPNNIESSILQTDSPFNRFTSYSKSTLVVPEIATLALMASPFAGLGLYAIRRRRK